jgi:hypothetical protein
MALLTKRQETAQRLTRELQALGATVTNPLPLEDGQALRFWVADYKKNEMLQHLRDAGYEPIFTSTGFQMCIASYSMGLVCNFELPLPAERQEIPQQDRTIPRDEIGKGGKRTHEYDAFVREWYGGKKR